MKTTRQLAIEWFNTFSSLGKTQLCDTHTEIVGNVRRWETLTGREIEMIYLAEHKMVRALKEMEVTKFLNNKHMKNQVIKVLTPEHGKKVIEYFLSMGAKNNKYLHGDSPGRYYGVIDSNEIKMYREIEVKNNSTIEIIELPENKEFMYTITPEQAQSIIDIAGEDWKNTLANKWSNEIVLKQSVDISEDFYRQMRQACTAKQHELFNEIFIKPFTAKKGDWVVIEDFGVFNSISFSTNKPYKLSKDFTGDNDLDFEKDDSGRTGNGFYKHHACTLKLRLATEEEIKKINFPKDGTPCLVKGSGDNGWNLRYSDGEGGFYLRGKKSGEKTYWEEWMILDMNNLPVNY